MSRWLLSALILAAVSSPAVAERLTKVATLASATACAHDAACLAVQFADALTTREVGPTTRRVLTVQFQPGRARVYSIDRERIQALVAVLQHHPRWSKITVEGFADPRVERDGLAVSQRRAERIRGYLIRYGIDPTLVVATGLGPTTSAKGPAGSGSQTTLTIEICDGDAPHCQAELPTE